MDPPHRRGLIAALAIAFVIGCAEDVSPPTPPLLDGVTARGGWWNDGCPARDAEEAKLFDPSNESLSPELTQRLQRQFPVGSDARQLERALRAQGFGPVEACANSAAIRHTEFLQTGGGIGHSTIGARVAWEERSGRIVWTKGSVQFTGP